MRSFKGSAILNLQSILFILINVIFLYLFIIQRIDLKFPLGLMIVLVIEVALYILLGSVMHYFIVNDDSLIIRNSWLFWVNKKIKIDNVELIEFKSPPRAGVSLIVTIRNSKKGYGCNQLSSSTLKDLHDTLKARGIDVHSSINF